MSRFPPLRPLALSVASLLLAAPIAAQQEPADAERVHVVRQGDTLWDLAGRYFGDPYLWPEIFRHNRATVANPHRIFPLERLLIPGLAGGEGGGVAEAAGPEVDRTVFFSGEREAGGTVQAGAEIEAARPVVEPGAFYRAGLLLQDAELSPAGVLVDVLAPSVVPGELRPQIAPYDRVYLQLASGATARMGDWLHFFRADREIPPHGRIFRSTGLARVESVTGGVAVLSVEQLFDQMRIGDVAVALRDFPVRAGHAPRRADGQHGRIIAFETQHPLPALQELAFLDLGGRSGVKEGDEFEAYLPRSREAWGERPEVAVARLQVVRTTERTATVRIVQVQHPVLAPGMPVRLVGKMP